MAVAIATTMLAMAVKLSLELRECHTTLGP